MEDILQTGRRLAEEYNRDGDGYKNEGRKNAYECEDCGSYIITVDRHPGVTPYMTKCGACGGIARSKFYRVQAWLEPTHEWYRPDNLAEIPQGSHEHISRGGLILRAMPGREDRWLAIDFKQGKVDHTADRDRIEAMKAMMDDAAKSGVVEIKTRQQRRWEERKGHREAPAEITMYGHRYRRVD
jgi:hypothetical protein